ncbi:hypothetical protein [Micromonospora profundi]
MLGARAARLEHELRQARARLLWIEAILAEANAAGCACQRLTGRPG